MCQNFSSSRKLNLGTCQVYLFPVWFLYDQVTFGKKYFLNWNIFKKKKKRKETFKEIMHLNKAQVSHNFFKAC